jgi:transcriptional regulator with XRE-family HTH domain
MTWNEKIRAWRKSQKMTLSEAGALVGVTKAQWSRYESATRRVAPELVRDMERITGVSRHEILPGVFGPEPTEHEQDGFTK